MSKWLRSLKFGNDYFRLIDSNAYFEAYQRYIASLLAREMCVVRLAVLTDDSDVVLGFSLIEGQTLHYVHVHRDQRHQGIGRSLVPKDVNTFTHVTKAALAIWPKYPNLKFNPFL